MKIHKLRNTATSFTECDKCLHLSGGYTTDNWKDVNCKMCLKKKDVAEDKPK